MSDDNKGLPELKRPFHETLSVNDRLDVLEFRRRTDVEYVDDPFNIQLYCGPTRQSNLESIRQINHRHDTERHATLDDKRIPRLMNELTQAEIDELNRPDRKLRMSSLSGANYSPILTDDNLTLKERIDLAVCCYGLYTAGTSEPNEVLDPRAHEFWIGDVSAAMDNLRVPRLRSEMTEEQKLKLAELRKPPKFVDYLDLFKSTASTPDPKLYDLARELARKHPIRIAPRPIRPIGDIEAVPFDWPIRHRGEFDHPIQLSHVSLGNGPSTFKTIKRRPRGAGHPNFVIDDGPFWNFQEFSQQDLMARLPAEWSFETKLRFKHHYGPEIVPSFARTVPKIRHDDSLEMFHAKMSNRPRNGLRVGRWIIEQAYAQQGYEVGPVVWMNPRQTGKTYLNLAFQWARRTRWGSPTWPRTSCGFFLHAAYDLRNSRESDHFYFYDNPWRNLIELVRADLFHHTSRIDYDKPNRRSQSTSRHPYRRP